MRDTAGRIISTAPTIPKKANVSHQAYFFMGVRSFSTRFLKFADIFIAV